MIRNEYSVMGVDRYYREIGSKYKNPHLHLVHHHLNHYDFKGKDVLDLGCGLGEVSLHILPDAKSIEGCDPFLHMEYMSKTSLHCHDLDFKRVSSGELGRVYDVIVCSFSLHLCEPSVLPRLLYQIANQTEELIVISPNKKPVIDCAFDMISKIKYKRVTSSHYVTKMR